jgi:anti-sigma factor RsiW
VPALPPACRAADQDLSALIDEELAPARTAELRAHLEHCERCTRRLQQLCNVDLALASLRAPEVAPDLRPRLAARLAQLERGGRSETGARGPAPTPARRWLARRAAGLAAVAAALILALYATLRGGGSSAPEPAQFAQPSPPASPQAEAPQPERSAAPLLAERETQVPASRRVARLEPTPAPLAEPDLASLSEEDLALLFVLEDVEDLDVIANLDLLERLVDLEPAEGAG